MQVDCCNLTLSNLLYRSESITKPSSPKSLSASPAPGSAPATPSAPPSPKTAVSPRRSALAKTVEDSATDSADEITEVTASVSRDRTPGPVVVQVRDLSV